ncbi:uncharacterized protein LOC106664455 [Cimex lectularius]|uniref:Uncharacterized protein n=1 Tax=Cimex lectularius TaxID=79782 RepID=A0A8I6RG71_CIMLE|nr:uncharacterized protein LOC106664455 [Cimex lectularius]
MRLCETLWLGLQGDVPILRARGHLGLPVLTKLASVGRRGCSAKIMNIDNGPKLFSNYKPQPNGQKNNLIQIAMDTINYRSLPNIHSHQGTKDSQFNFKEIPAYLELKNYGERVKNFFLNEMNGESKNKNGILGISYSQAKRITNSNPRHKCDM